MSLPIVEIQLGPGPYDGSITVDGVKLPKTYAVRVERTVGQDPTVHISMYAQVSVRGEGEVTLNLSDPQLNAEAIAQRAVEIIERRIQARR